MIKQRLRVRINAIPLHNNLNQAITVKRRIMLAEKSKRLLRPTLLEIIKANQKNGEFRLPFRGACALQLEFIYGDDRGHDWDNAVTDHKPWQDLFTNLGFINDDKQIDEAHVFVKRHPSGPATIITLCEKD